MNLTFHAAQQQVDERVLQHPDGYRPDKKMFDKVLEEHKETKEALEHYQQSPTQENLQAFKTEIGDMLFALICIANKCNISLEESFTLMIAKNHARAKNQYKK